MTSQERLMLAFFNVGSDSMTYDVHATLEDAVAVLMRSPEEIIAVILVTPACLRYLTDPDYGLESALRDGMSFAEYTRVLEEEQRQQQS